MQRRMTHASLFVPIAVSPDGTRHIIPSRDGAPLCGVERTGAMQIYAPDNIQSARLCPRCKQKHMRGVQGVDKGGGW